jgi:metal-dependent amidase/aminoacylase/carboxypeptidase family protein
VQILDAINRIVLGEAVTSGAPEPLIEHTESLPATINDPEETAKVMAAFESRFGSDAVLAPGAVSGSEDVGLFATAAGAPLVYWILGERTRRSSNKRPATGPRTRTSRPTTPRTSRPCRIQRSGEESMR